MLSIDIKFNVRPSIYFNYLAMDNSPILALLITIFSIFIIRKLFAYFKTSFPLLPPFCPATKTTIKDCPTVLQTTNKLNTNDNPSDSSKMPLDFDSKNPNSISNYSNEDLTYPYPENVHFDYQIYHDTNPDRNEPEILHEISSEVDQNLTQEQNGPGTSYHNPSLILIEPQEGELNEINSNHCIISTLHEEASYIISDTIAKDDSQGETNFTNEFKNSKNLNQERKFSENHSESYPISAPQNESCFISENTIKDDSKDETNFTNEFNKNFLQERELNKTNSESCLISAPQNEVTDFISDNITKDSSQDEMNFKTELKNNESFLFYSTRETSTCETNIDQNPDFNLPFYDKNCDHSIDLTYNQNNLPFKNLSNDHPSLNSTFKSFINNTFTINSNANQELYANLDDSFNKFSQDHEKSQANLSSATETNPNKITSHNVYHECNQIPVNKFEPSDPSSNTLNSSTLQTEPNEAFNYLTLKAEGNTAFGKGNYRKAISLYSQALEFCPKTEPDNIAIILSNRAACYLSLEDWNSVISDCTDAIVFNPRYIKAYTRRLAARESLKMWDKALEDTNKIIELDPSKRNHIEKRQEKIKQTVQIEQEKEKEEVIGKLKDLGNSLLGKFGLSLDNFKATQNESGSYNINYVPNS